MQISKVQTLQEITDLINSGNLTKYQRRAVFEPLSLDAQLKKYTENKALETLPYPLFILIQMCNTAQLAAETPIGDTPCARLALDKIWVVNEADKNLSMKDIDTKFRQVHNLDPVDRVIPDDRFIEAYEMAELRDLVAAGKMELVRE